VKCAPIPVSLETGALPAAGHFGVSIFYHRYIGTAQKFVARLPQMSVFQTFEKVQCPST